MAKKPDLTVAMQKASGQAVKAAKSVVDKTIDAKEDKRALQASRDGKRSVVGYFDPAVSKQLKQIALDEDSNVQELIREAINDLFIKRGKLPIA